MAGPSAIISARSASKIAFRSSAPYCPKAVFPPIDGVIGRQLVDSEDFWVLRFRLMVKRGPRMRPQASEREAQHGLFLLVSGRGAGLVGAIHIFIPIA